MDLKVLNKFTIYFLYHLHNTMLNCTLKNCLYAETSNNDR